MGVTLLSVQFGVNRQQHCVMLKPLRPLTFYHRRIPKLVTLPDLPLTRSRVPQNLASPKRKH